MNKSRYIWGILVGTLVLVGAIWLYNRNQAGSTEQANGIQIDPLLLNLANNPIGYTSADEGYVWNFPSDYATHDAYQAESWSYSGLLNTENDARFMYQVTIFRRAISPLVVESESEWRTNQFYTGHVSLVDLQNETRYIDNRLSRGAAGLAGATETRLWIVDWQIADNVLSVSGDDFRLNLSLDSNNAAPILQGENGFVSRPDERGSLAYSQVRLDTVGTLTLDETSYDVSGKSWFDHEFHSLGLDASDQNWLRLWLNDGRLVMVRAFDNSVQNGFIIASDGTRAELDADSMRLETLQTWTSPQTGIAYPTELRINLDDEQFDLRAVIDNQEIGGDLPYWKGTVSISGDANGFGMADFFRLGRLIAES